MGWCWSAMGCDARGCSSMQRMQRVQVHHLKFRSQLGSEKEQSLITLCAECHARMHRKSNYPPAEPEALRLLAPQRGLIATDQSQKQAQRTCAGIPDVLKTGRSTLPDLSNFYCLPGRAGGSLNGLERIWHRHHPQSA